KHFGVRSGAVNDPCVLQLRSQISVVVDLAVEHERTRSVAAAERLIGSMIGIDDAEPAMAQHDLVAQPFALCIGPTVGQRIDHAPDVRARIIEPLQPEYAGDAAHQWPAGMVARMRSSPSRSATGSRPKSDRIRVMSGMRRVMSPSSSGGRCTIFERLPVMSMIRSASCLIEISTSDPMFATSFTTSPRWKAIRQASMLSMM